MSSPYKSLQIDEEGYLLSQGVRLVDEELSAGMLSSITRGEDWVYRINAGGEVVIAEPFDHPFVAQQVHKSQGTWTIQLPYQIFLEFDPKKLSLDFKDRFVGIIEKSSVPFVFSRKAQAEFFNLLTDFDDDSITIDGERFPIPDLYQENTDIDSHGFWTKLYQEDKAPPWDLGGPHPGLESVLSRLKLNKLRILVLGAGGSHDADFLARQGHKVTAVDISEESIKKARDHYGKNPNLTFLHSDVFELNKSLKDETRDSFDLVFEYTCYCAINPQRRQELIKVWKHCLAPGGHLLGLFWIFFKPVGPPYGSTEWEIRENLKKDFRFLIWERVKESPPHRQGIELLVFAEKLEKL